MAPNEKHEICITSSDLEITLEEEQIIHRISKLDKNGATVNPPKKQW